MIFIIEYIGKFLIISLVPWLVFECIRMISDFSLTYKEGKCGFLTFITGSYLAPQNCKVIFDWKSPTSVSNLATFSIKFYQRNHKPYPITHQDQLSVHITSGSQVISCSIEFGDQNPNLANMARVSFSPKKSGYYTISIMVGNTFAHVRGSPFEDIFFKPLNPSPYETLFVNHCSTSVCTEKNFHTLIVETRDRFGNLCLLDDDINATFDASSDFNVLVTEIGTNKKLDICYYWERPSDEQSRISLMLVIESSGVYHCLVSYKSSQLKNGDFNIICLTETEADQVRKCTVLSNSKSCYFNAKFLPLNTTPLSSQVFCWSLDEANQSAIVAKLKNVVCYISPKQLTVKEYILKFIPKRIATFRLLPSTKFFFAPNYSQQNSQTFSSHFVNGNSLPNVESDFLAVSNSFVLSQEFMIIDDGSQPPVWLLCPQRNTVVAIFTHFLLNRIGGSETFRDKQDFFYAQLRNHHVRNITNGKVLLKISRENLLESSMRASKSLVQMDWCKKFEIEFIAENGIDWGGLRREWNELLCRALFETDEFSKINVGNPSLFVRFRNDRQSLIHPNADCTSKSGIFEFAGRIIAKNLLDSALRHNCKCLINARFTRSFLAQWIGLRVNYRHFEQDDPDLWIRKIKFMLDNDVSTLELFFVEEEYDKLTGKLIKTIDLIPNGSNIRVNDKNKIRYLDALAQYRLATRVKDQVEAFLKGLNDLIPDNLLSIFDENEIELLVCGSATYSLSDLRLNHVVTGAHYDFQKVVDWFWRSLATFDDEEFSRLLQFTTGCSLLPPGGFSELNPRFQISSAPTLGTLPTAHTCFNQICLPDYDSFEDFDRSLKIAITEGSEGFGLV